jgi:sulfide:quinone oxidoreductase
MCVDGWIPVDPLTLQTAFADVYAVGDVTSVGTPKAGVFAEGQAIVVADEIVARHRARESTSRYDGRGICYLEFGGDRVGRVEVTFRRGEPPNGRFDDASALYTADKAEFGSSRILRWFGNEWTAH